MTRDEMVDNLGCIARSGSKAFMEQCREGGEVDPKEIIGQFGVRLLLGSNLSNLI